MQKKHLLKNTSSLLLALLLGFLFLLGTFYIGFQKAYEKKVYPGVRIGGVDFGGKTKDDVKAFFDKKNERFSKTRFVFSYEKEPVTTLSAKELSFGFNSKLLADQAYGLGRSSNIFSNLGIIVISFEGETNLSPSYRFSEDVLRKTLKSTENKIFIEPTDALFSFQNGKVVAFRLSSDGAQLDWETLLANLEGKSSLISLEKAYDTVEIPVPVKVIKPKVATTDVNSFGIKDKIGSGKSSFVGSIPNRVHNISLAASTINGVLIAPGEVFSFNDALGDVSKFTGYKEAYIIKEGRTVLGDGGGVCQVSTTFFRALLNSGLPIVERHAHSYRVGYYEQDSGPGFDATIYAPSFDLRFKNDTGHHILVQAVIDTFAMRLEFDLYGTGDDRQTTITQAVITNQTQAPADQYVDDPTLPAGVVKQVDFKAAGADTTFARKVERQGSILTSENFKSHYSPWQAVYLRGTKEQ